METLKVATAVIAARFEDEKKKLESAKKDFVKAAYQRRCQMLLEALTILSCIDEPVNISENEADN